VCKFAIDLMREIFNISRESVRDEGEGIELGVIGCEVIFLCMVARGMQGFSSSLAPMKESCCKELFNVLTGELRNSNLDEYMQFLRECKDGIDSGSMRVYAIFFPGVIHRLQVSCRDTLHISPVYCGLEYTFSLKRSIHYLT